MKPKISAYAHFYETHDYNAAPFVPIGMETLVNNNPEIRGAFSEHCIKGLVIGTAFENYGPWIMWMKDTRATGTSATVFHNHKYITNPYITPEGRVISAAGKLEDTLKGRISPHLSETKLKQLERIRTILKH